MAVEEDPISQGYAAGVQRVLASGLLQDVDAESEEVVQASLSIATPLLVEREASPRFAALFVELVTVAALARVANDEPPLTDADIGDFFLSTWRFTNSWFGWFCRDEDR